MVWIVVLAFLILACVAVQLYNFLEGETLFSDLYDEWQLSRLSLAAMVRNWADPAAGKSNVVVALTTTPSRIDLLEPTLKSILRQSVPPARIILNLPDFCHREARGYTLPHFLTASPQIEIHPCADNGPITKLLPLLNVLSPDTPILVVDDDRIYPADLISTLLKARQSLGDVAVGVSGWCIPKDQIDRPTTILSNLRMQAPAPIRARRLKKPLHVDVLQGYSGYLVNPRQLDRSFPDAFLASPAALKTVDDVWISAFLTVPCLVVPMRRGNYQSWRRRRHYRRTSLGLINRGPTGRNQDRTNSRAIAILWERFISKRLAIADVK